MVLHDARQVQLALDEDIANKYFDVLTDTVGEPTGKAFGGFRACLPRLMPQATPSTRPPMP